MKLVIQL